MKVINGYSDCCQASARFGEIDLDEDSYIFKEKPRTKTG